MAMLLSKGASMESEMAGILHESPGRPKVAKNRPREKQAFYWGTAG
jgi:hypothetical protein